MKNSSAKKVAESASKAVSLEGKYREILGSGGATSVAGSFHDLSQPSPYKYVPTKSSNALIG